MRENEPNLATADGYTHAGDITKGLRKPKSTTHAFHYIAARPDGKQAEFACASSDFLAQAAFTLEEYCTRLEVTGSQLNGWFSAAFEASGENCCEGQSACAQQLLVQLFFLVDQIQQLSAEFRRREQEGTSAGEEHEKMLDLQPFNQSSVFFEEPFLLRILEKLNGYRELLHKVQRHANRQRFEELHEMQSPSDIEFPQALEYASGLLMQVERLESGMQDLERRNVALGLENLQLRFYKTEIGAGLENMLCVCQEALRNSGESQLKNCLLQINEELVAMTECHSGPKLVNRGTMAEDCVQEELEQQNSLDISRLKSKIEVLETLTFEQEARIQQQQTEISRYLTEIELLSNQAASSTAKQQYLQEELDVRTEELQRSTEEYKETRSAAALFASELGDMQNRTQQLQRQCALLLEERRAIISQKQQESEERSRNEAESEREVLGKLLECEDSICDGINRLIDECNEKSIKPQLEILEKAQILNVKDLDTMLLGVDNIVQVLIRRIAEQSHEQEAAESQAITLNDHIERLQIGNVEMKNSLQQSRTQIQKLLAISSQAVRTLEEIQTNDVIFESRMQQRVDALNFVLEDTVLFESGEASKCTATELHREAIEAIRYFQTAANDFGEKTTKLEAALEQSKMQQKRVFEEYLRVNSALEKTIQREEALQASNERDAAILQELPKLVDEMASKLSLAEAKELRARTASKEYQEIIELEEQEISKLGGGKAGKVHQFHESLQALENSINSEVLDSERLKIENGTLRLAFERLSQSLTAGTHLLDTDDI